MTHGVRETAMIDLTDAKGSKIRAQAAARARKLRERTALGIRVLHVEVNFNRFAEFAIEAGLIDPDQSEDAEKLARVAARVLETAASNFLVTRD